MTIHNQSDNELKSTGYELFIILLSLTSLFNIIIIIAPVDDIISDVAVVMDRFITVVFIFDFLYRLFSAESKTRYFIYNWGWADLIASMPFIGLRVLRIFRILRVLRLLKQIGPRELMHQILFNRAGSAMYLTLFLIIFVVEFGGMAIVFAEANSNGANITTAQEGIWWAFVTITTVGYGDFYPISSLGRFISILVMTLGVGTFGVLTGFLANAFLFRDTDDDRSRVQQDETEVDIRKLKELLDEQERINALLREQIAKIENKMSTTSQ